MRCLFFYINDAYFYKNKSNYGIKRDYPEPGGLPLIFTISLRHACEKGKGILKTAAAVLIVILIIIRLLVWLANLNMPEPKLRDQIKEKPLRVEFLDEKRFGYNNS